MEYLIDKKIDFKQVNNFNSNIFHFAANYDNVEIIRYMAKKLKSKF